MNDKVLNVKMSSELYARLQEEAKRKNIALASLVRMLCAEYLDNKKKSN